MKSVIDFPNVMQIHGASLRLPSMHQTHTSESLTMFYKVREQTLLKDIHATEQTLLKDMHNCIMLLRIMYFLRNELYSVY